MERKIFSVEWKWNGGKLPVWTMKKSFSIPFHAMPCRQQKSNKIAYKINLPAFF